MTLIAHDAFGGDYEDWRITVIPAITSNRRSRHPRSDVGGLYGPRWWTVATWRHVQGCRVVRLHLQLPGQRRPEPAKGQLKIELSYTDKGSNPLGSAFGIHGTVDRIDPVLESAICIGTNPPPGGNELIFLG